MEFCSVHFAELEAENARLIASAPELLQELNNIANAKGEKSSPDLTTGDF